MINYIDYKNWYNELLHMCACPVVVDNDIEVMVMSIKELLVQQAGQKYTSIRDVFFIKESLQSSLVDSIKEIKL